MVKSFRIIFTALLFCISVHAQEITASASTDSSDYMIGDFIHYKIIVSSDHNVSVLSAGLIDSAANVELISIDEPKIEKVENKKITTLGFTISKYDSAEVNIPPIPVYYKTGSDDQSNQFQIITPEQAANDPSIKTVMTNPVSFTVHSMKLNVKEEIKDVKEPITIPLDWKIIALWVLIGLAVLSIIYFLYKKYWKKKETAERKIIVLPPHVNALNSLKELEEKKLWQNGEIKQYHSEITGIIRKYFEERFNLPALELTTSEAMLHLRSTGGAEQIINITYDFLSNADLVKFAKYTPMNSVNEEMMKQAYEIVNKTIPVKETAAVEAESDVQ